MTDMERDLRDMMQRTADGLNHLPRAGQGLVRRARLSRARTAVVTGVMTVALVVGGFAGARSLTRDDAAPVPPADKSSPTERAVTIVEGSGEVHSGAVRSLCEFLFQECEDVFPGVRLLSVEVSATQVGGDISGSGSLQGVGLDEPFTVRCSTEISDLVAAGGTFDEEERAGEGIVLVIEDDLQGDRLTVLYFRGKGNASDDGCESMLSNMQVWLGSEPGDLIPRPLKSGDFTIGGEE